MTTVVDSNLFICFDFFPLPQHSPIGTRTRARIIVSSFSSQWWTYPRWSSDSCFGLFTQPALSLLGAARFQKKPGITMTMDPLKGIGTRPTWGGTRVTYPGTAGTDCTCSLTYSYNKIVFHAFDQSFIDGVRECVQIQSSYMRRETL